MKDSLVTADSFKWVCNEIFGSNNTTCSPDLRRIPAGAIIFCKIDYVMDFFEKIRLTRKRVILVTGEGDIPCDEFRHAFLPANVIHWYATNVTHPHPRVTALPLGLGATSDPVTLSHDQIVAGRTQGIPRNKWLYVNFRPETNASVRQPIFDYFAQFSESESWITMEKGVASVGNKGFLQQLLTHRFVLCPPGNGVDTHRMWETLAAGAIPVVLRSEAMEPFKELPILFVNKYEEVTLGMLEEAARRIRPALSEEPMLQDEFWIMKIQEAALVSQISGVMPWGEWIMESMKYVIGMAARKVGLNG